MTNFCFTSDMFLLCSVMNIFFSWLYVRVQALHGLPYRCFHFARLEFTEHGVTKSVGICECKPDACLPVFGDTHLRAGVLALNKYIYLLEVSLVTYVSCFLL